MNCHFLKVFSFTVLAFILACQPTSQQNSKQKLIDQAYLERDLLAQGPYLVEESLYKEEPRVDNDVLPEAPDGLPDVKVDIRGKLYLPQGSGPFPVLVFLHGNHSTCGRTTGPGNPRLDVSTDFTLKGACPDGMIESPSFLGYEYAARHMASWGYAVISINANLGITGRDGYDARDSNLIYARGALVLKHLMRLRAWSKNGAGDALQNAALRLENKFDLTEVGLMGHSRGGEGVRYAYNIFQKAEADSPWKRALPELRIKGIFEIAPVDFGSGRGPLKVEAFGTPWTVLLGGCDSDVNVFLGANPYARMLAGDDGWPKSVFTLWGANHNFFNTEWQVSDAPHRCSGSQKPLWNTQASALAGVEGTDSANALEGVTGSPIQQTFAKGLLYAFFRAHVGKDVDPTLSRIFDPQYALPLSLDRLAPSSREFIRLHDSVLLAKPGKTTTGPQTVGAITLRNLADKLQADLGQLQSYWDAYAREKGFDRLEVGLANDSFARQALILEAPTLSTEQSIDIPFDAPTETRDYWTIDSTLARRTACYTYPESDCQPDASIAQLDLALIYEDGSSSRFVHLSDYVRLANYHSKYFELAYSEPVANGTNSYRLKFSYVPLLFTTARFELTDFKLSSSRIKGLRLKFPAGQPVALALDEIRLVKRPDVASNSL